MMIPVPVSQCPLLATNSETILSGSTRITGTERTTARDKDSDFVCGVAHSPKQSSFVDETFDGTPAFKSSASIKLKLTQYNYFTWAELRSQPFAHRIYWLHDDQQRKPAPASTFP